MVPSLPLRRAIDHNSCQIATPRDYVVSNGNNLNQLSTQVESSVNCMKACVTWVTIWLRMNGFYIFIITIQKSSPYPWVPIRGPGDNRQAPLQAIRHLTDPARSSGASGRHGFRACVWSRRNYIPRPRPTAHLG